MSCENVNLDKTSVAELEGYREFHEVQLRLAALADTLSNPMSGYLFVGPAVLYQVEKLNEINRALAQKSQSK